MPCLTALVFTDADTPLVIGLIVIGLMFVGPALFAWMRIVAWWRGQKEDVSRFVTREELATFEARMKSDMRTFTEGVKDDLDDLKTNVKELTRSIHEILKDYASINRSLGRVEGEQDAPAMTPPPRDKRRR